MAYYLYIANDETPIYIKNYSSTDYLKNCSLLLKSNKITEKISNNVICVRSKNRCYGILKKAYSYVIVYDTSATQQIKQIFIELDSYESTLLTYQSPLPKEVTDTIDKMFASKITTLDTIKCLIPQMNEQIKDSIDKMFIKNDLLGNLEEKTMMISTISFSFSENAVILRKKRERQLRRWYCCIGTLIMIILIAVVIVFYL